MTTERQAVNVLAQSSLAPLGTCLRVGIYECRVAVREGREIPMVELEVETEVEAETDGAMPEGASTAATGARARAFGEQALGEGVPVEEDIGEGAD